MIRSSRVLLGLLLASSAAAGLVATAGGASAATVQSRTAKVVTFTGKISCAVSGTVTAQPPLSLSTKKATTLTYRAVLTKCTGATKKGAVKIVKGSLSGTSKASLDCEGLLTGLPALHGSVSYTTKGGEAKATGFSFAGGKLALTSPIALTYPKSGTGRSTGSFAGKAASLVAKLPASESESALATACHSGLKTIKLASGTFKA